jgi:hypothetical protein
MGMGGQRHAPAALPRERPGTHCMGGWVGPRAGVDGCGISRLASGGTRSPDCPSRSESLYRLSRPGPLMLCTLAWILIGSNCIFDFQNTKRQCIYVLKNLFEIPGLVMKYGMYVGVILVLQSSREIYCFIFSPCIFHPQSFIRTKECTITLHHLFSVCHWNV